MRNFHKEGKLSLIQPPIAAGSTGTGGTASHVDNKGFDSVALVGIVGTQGTTCLVTLRAQGSTSSTAWTNLGSAAVTSVANADDKFLLVDVIRPAYRYIRGTFTRSSTAGGSEFGGVLAVQYGAKHFPVTQDTGTRGSTGSLVLTT